MADAIPSWAQGSDTADSGVAPAWAQETAPTKATSPSESPKPSKGILTKGLENTAAAVDTVLSIPGAVLGPLASATGRWVAIAKGADGKDVSAFGHEFGQAVSDSLSQPIQKLLELSGYKGGYKESEVSGALNHVGEAIAKGGDYLSEHSGGMINKTDANDLVNAASMLVIPGAAKLTAKALVGVGKIRAGAKAPIEEPTLRPDVADEPAAVKPGTTPEELAKQHAAEIKPVDSSVVGQVNKQLGIKTEKEAKVFRDKQRADAKAAFANDPEYADYLKGYAEEKVMARDAANELAADKLEAENKARSYGTESGKTDTKPVNWTNVVGIYKKPGFQRTAEDLLKLREFNKQAGGVDPKLLAGMAAVGIGTALGIYLDPEHPVEGALMGFALGGGAVKAVHNPGRAGRAIESVWKSDTRIRINEIADTHEASISKAARSVWQNQMDVMDAVKDPTRRNAIANWMQGDRSIPLTNSEYAAAMQARKFFDGMGKAGADSGVLGNLIPDYVTNLWDLEGKNKTTWGKLSQGPGMSENSRFNLQRKITSIAEGKKLGLIPLTEDVATIMGVYGNSLSRTMANKQLMDTLRTTNVPGSADMLMMPTMNAPKNYAPIEHGQLRGQVVHPDIAPSMKFLFNQKSPSGIMAGIEGLNTALKRSAVSFSLFHAKALTDAFIGAGGNPIKIAGMVAGTNKFLQMVRNGGAGDLVDHAYEGGLKFSLDKGALADEDVGGSFYTAMEGLQSFVGTAIPGADKLVGKSIELNHAVDTLMWSRLHAGMKLEVFASAREKLMQNNAEANTKNPGVPLKTSKEINGIAASYTNDIFGGLNWRRAAEESRTKWGRDLALGVYSPGGRRVMQLAMFAPDWTISTTRAAAKAFGAGSGPGGVLKPQELADLHRQYVLRSAAYYFTVGNALNYAMSGHGIMDNKDPTVLELGDGRTMQFSKHAMEPVHWLTKPTQQAMNKLGFLPSELAEQAGGVEYLSASGKASKMDTSAAGRARHMLKRAVPIAASQGAAGIAAGVSGAVGFPIYGQKKSKAETD